MARVPEEPFTGTDQPLAQRRVDDEVAGVLLCVPLDAVREEVVTLGRVIDFVEDLAGRVTEADETQYSRDRDDDGSGDPREHGVVRHFRRETAPYDLGDRYACRARGVVEGRVWRRVVRDGYRSHPPIVGCAP